jgi:hypothetical protein
VPGDVSTCINFHYRRAFAFSSIPFLYCYRFSLRITFLDFILGAIQGFQAQHRKVYWVRHALSIERIIGHETLIKNKFPSSFAFWLQCINHLHCLSINGLYHAFTLHLPYQLSSTHPVYGYQEGLLLTILTPDRNPSLHCQARS